MRTASSKMLHKNTIHSLPHIIRGRLFFKVFIAALKQQLPQYVENTSLLRLVCRRVRFRARSCPTTYSFRIHFCRPASSGWMTSRRCWRRCCEWRSTSWRTGREFRHWDFPASLCCTSRRVTWILCKQNAYASNQDVHFKKMFVFTQLNIFKIEAQLIKDTDLSLRLTDDNGITLQK